MTTALKSNTNGADATEPSMKLTSQPDSQQDGEPSGPAHVLVYGSLKQSCGNHCLLERINAKWLGYDSITGDFAMISLGGFPGVVRRPEYKDSLSTIFGELYAVDTEGLAALDMLESHPDFYERIKYRTDVIDRRAWMYTLPLGEGYLNSDLYATVDSCIWQPTEDESGFWLDKDGIDLRD